MTWTAAERRDWLENTPAGRIRRAYGMTAEPLSREEIRRYVSDVADHVWEFRGRDLTATERESLAVGALSAGVVVQDSSDGVARHLGWTVIHDNPVTRGAGLIRREAGRWVGDPDTVARAEAAEAAHFAATGERPRWDA